MRPIVSVIPYEAGPAAMLSGCRVRPVPPPKALQANLRSYQLQGLSYLNFLSEYGFGGILADEMGLGKTVQTLAFIQHMVESRFEGPNLIVVPTSVLPNWEREAEKFVPGLRRLTIYGTRREGMFKHIAESDLIISTYALLRRDLEEMEKYEFNTVILDEAQNIKNPNTITARAVRRIHARMRLCLSGTPIENNLFELWSLFEFLMPGFLGSQHAFQRGIVKPIKDGDSETLDYLRTRVRRIIMRRTKAEVAKDLPPKVESVTCCALEEAQAELYAALARKLRAQVLADVDEKGLAKSQMSILDALLKLRQICCDPALCFEDYTGESAKLETCVSLIASASAAGHKILLFSQFASMLERIRERLLQEGISSHLLVGATPKEERSRMVQAFASDEVSVFLISLKAGGTGLNLTAADIVIHYDPWWNVAAQNQATDRAYRIGQEKPVTVYKLILKDTIEENLLKLQNAKLALAAQVVSEGMVSLGDLSQNELMELFEQNP